MEFPGLGGQLSGGPTQGCRPASPGAGPLPAGPGRCGGPVPQGRLDAGGPGPSGALCRFSAGPRPGPALVHGGRENAAQGPARASRRRPRPGVQTPWLSQASQEEAEALEVGAGHAEESTGRGVTAGRSLAAANRPNVEVDRLEGCANAATVEVHLPGGGTRVDGDASRRPVAGRLNA